MTQLQTTNTVGDEHLLHIGDTISGRHTFGINKYPITRVTPKFAFSYVSDTYEAKFYRDTRKGLAPLPRQQYAMVDYSLKRASK